MTDKEKLEAIRVEIHRLVNVRGYDREMANDLFAFMDSLPNEPVSEELLIAARRASVDKPETPLDFLYERPYNPIEEQKFIDGANWYKQQFEKNRLKHCDSITNEQVELEQGFIDQHLDKYNRMPSFLDAIEYGMNLQKQQMMTKSIEAVVSQVPCSNEIILYNPSSVDEYYLPQEMNKLGLNKGDKVKLIIIKKD